MPISDSQSRVSLIVLLQRPSEPVAAKISLRVVILASLAARNERRKARIALWSGVEVHDWPGTDRVRRWLHEVRIEV